MCSRIRFGIIGSGWRALYYVRIAKALPDLFELCGMVCRTAEKASRIQQEYGIPVCTDAKELAEKQPGFVVVAVDKAHVLEVGMEWLQKGFAVLAETPAAVDRASLRQMKDIAAAGKKFVTAEQYRLYPENTARMRLAQKGMIGTPSYVYLSLAHEYHAASLMRAFLEISPEMPYTIQAYASSFPTAETLSRFEQYTDGRIAAKTRTCAVIAFENGRTCLYDFDSEQYRSPIRSSHWKLQGTRGEIFDDTAVWLDEHNQPCREKIITQSSVVHTGDANPNFRQYETIEQITFAGEILYEHSKIIHGLSQDDTAIVQMLMQMASYAKGEGEAPYSLQESIADAELGIVLREAAETGKCMHAGELLQ